MARFFNVVLADEIDGVFNVSLVDEPAVESNFIYFNKEKKPTHFSIDNEEEHKITGVILRADYPIYRYNENIGEYYLTFGKEVIEQIAQKMLAEHTQNNINLMHIEGTEVEGVEMLEMFIKNTDKGINPAGFEDISEGSLFGTYKVENEDIWASIKDGTFKGFSVEAYLSYVETEEFKKQNKINKKDTKMTKLKNALKKLLAEFGSIDTNKGTLDYDGDLEVGVEVTINDEVAADGEYETDEKIIVVGEGKVTEIRDKATEDEEEVKPIEEVADEVEMSAQKKIAQAFSETYDEKKSKIYDAIAAVGNYDCWIVEASDEYAVAEVWTSEGYKYMRYEIEWDADGNAVIKSFAEVKAAYITEEQEEIIEEAQEEVKEDTVEVPVEETPAEETEIEALRKENAELKAQLAKPVNAPIEEQFQASNNSNKGNNKLANACRLASAGRE